MRIMYYSDIHIELLTGSTRRSWTKTYPLDLGPRLLEFVGTTDLVILAGDIGTFRDYDGVNAQGYALQVSEYLGCPVILVPGNHEYYRGVFDVGKFPETQPGVTVLDRGQALFQTSNGELRILGATLWTDYAVHGNHELAMMIAEQQIADHRLIKMPSGKTFTPADARRQHILDRQWLAESLLRPYDGPTIVVTHHVPSSALRNKKFPASPLGAAFHSDCDDLIEIAAKAGVIAWIFGHHHACVDQEIFGIRFVSAQMGYKREVTGWSGPGLLEI